MAATERDVRWMFLAAATVLALYLCWSMLEPFVLVLIWAGVLVIVFQPIHRRILRRTGRAGLSAFLSLLIVLATVVVPLTAIASALVVEVTHLKQSAEGTVQALLSDPASGGKLQQWMDAVNQRLHLEPWLSPDSVKELVGKIGQFVVTGAVTVLGGALGFVASLFVMLFTMYYLFRDGERIAGFLPKVIPLSRDRTEAILRRTTDLINVSVYGILVIATLQGTLGGLMFWILGIPSPLLWGVLMTVLSTIPFAGSYFVWVPAAVFLGATGHWAKAGILVAWGIFVIGTVDNLLRPRLVGRKAHMHDLVVFFSVLGGIKVFGFLGLLLGPVIVSMTLALIEVVLEGAEARVD